MADKSTKKKLNKISGQLKKASNMHAAQSKKIATLANSFNGGGLVRKGTFKGTF